MSRPASPENNNRVRFTTTINKESLKKLKICAIIEDLDINELLEKWIEEQSVEKWIKGQSKEQSKK